jgi:hypothetical protein
MKKVIVILILVIYLASIAVVNIFYQPFGISETNVYIKSIEIVKVSFGDGTVLYEPNKELSVPDAQGNHSTIPMFQFDFTTPDSLEEPVDSYTKENIIINPNSIFFELKYTTTSSDPTVKADNQKIYIVSSDENEDSTFLINDNNERTLVFHERGTVILTFSAADGYGAECKIAIRAKK